MLALQLGVRGAAKGLEPSCRYSMEFVPEAHAVLAHEMHFLVEEFRLDHFTACAMRGGRSLESMVYELSGRWGIEIQDVAFGKLDELRKNLDQIGNLIGETIPNTDVCVEMQCVMPCTKPIFPKPAAKIFEPSNSIPEGGKYEGSSILEST